MEARVEGCSIWLESLEIVEPDASCPLILRRAVKQEIDRNEDLIRSCLRAVAALDALPGSREVQAWDGLMTSLIGGPGFKVGCLKRLSSTRTDIESIGLLVTFWLEYSAQHVFYVQVIFGCSILECSTRQLPPHALIHPPT